MSTEPHLSSKLEAVKELTECIKQLAEEAKSALRQAAEDMARCHDAHKLSPFGLGQCRWAQPLTLTVNSDCADS